MSLSINQNDNMGIFYKVRDEDNKTRGYLYGTVHIILNDSNFTLNERVKKAFERSKILIVEADILKDERMLDAIPGSNFEDKLSALKKINKPHSIDLELLIGAYETHKDVIGLESLEEQRAITKEWEKEFSKNVTEKFFNMNILKGSQTQEEKVFKKEFDEMSELKDIAHKTSNEEIIEKVAMHGCSKEFYIRFNDERNLKMAEKINRFLNRGEKQFIAVGAGHVVGEAGIVNLLREKGWILEKIEN